jgi:hypothetical protein
VPIHPPCVSGERSHARPRVQGQTCLLQPHLQGLLCVQDQGAKFFTTEMVTFLTAAEAEALQLKADVGSCMEQLQELYGYLGEKYDGNDPMRILGIVSTFMDTFDKAISTINVRTSAPSGLKSCKEAHAHR